MVIPVLPQYAIQIYTNHEDLLSQATGIESLEGTYGTSYMQ